jgi:NAD(P)-dependent dehydrogenase (short-subunit alcohol dehydrogenase family)
MGDFHHLVRFSADAAIVSSNFKAAISRSAEISMKTILITGVSSGLGRAIAEATLARGHRVIGTVRDEAARLGFEQIAPGRAFGRILDVTDTAAIVPLVDAVEAEHGPIDVLVNNAGYGHRGVLEEVALKDLRQQFEVNVFGPVALIQAVLPGMRTRGSGHIVNVTSMGATVTFPGLGAYHGSKFALQGLGDTLAQEIAPFGIRVTSVQPGVYRSDWGGRSQSTSERRVAGYDWVFDPARTAGLAWGDPRALGQVVATAIDDDEPPLHLLVGPTALRMVRQQLASLSAEIDRWQKLSMADGEG